MLKNKLERVQKQAAAMREALAFAVECANNLLEYNGSDFQFHMRGMLWKLKTRSGAALQPDAGSDYIRRDEVVAIRNALDSCKHALSNLLIRNAEEALAATDSPRTGHMP